MRDEEETIDRPGHKQTGPEIDRVRRDPGAVPLPLAAVMVYGRQGLPGQPPTHTRYVYCRLAPQPPPCGLEALPPLWRQERAGVLRCSGAAGAQVTGANVAARPSAPLCSTGL